MKKTHVIIWLALSGLLFSSTPAVAKKNVIKSFDIKKIKASQYTKFIENIFWYSQEVLDKKRISNKLIKTDMQKFKDILHTILKPEYLLSDKVIDSNAVAVENLKNKNDYILLEYIIHKRKIQIQDGKALYLSVLPIEDSNTAPSDLAEYVKSVAFQLMKLPKTDKNGKELQVFVSPRDIGGSSCGVISYGPDPDFFQFWYSYMKWWSDGKNVLFLIGKTSFKGIDYSKMARRPEKSKKPRKFKKKDIKEK